MLQVYVRYGNGLSNGNYYDSSDPYVLLVAYNNDGDSKHLETRFEPNTLDPQWNEWLNFGEDSWSRLSVTVYDEDGYGDVPTHDSKMHVRKPCDTGYIELDYYFQP